MVFPSWRILRSVTALTLVDFMLRRSQAKYVDPEKALEAKERGNQQFRAGQWALAISEYEEVSSGYWHLTSCSTYVPKFGMMETSVGSLGSHAL